MSFAFEVVVCGGGPAGAAAALALARARRRVAIVDPGPPGRDKICGDLLGTDALRTLARLGLLGEVTAGGWALDGAYLHAPAGRRYGAELRRATERGHEDFACVVPRRILDARLVAAACEAGAEVVDARVTGLLRSPGGAAAGVTTTAGAIDAPVTIGADGWGSVVARAAGAAPPPASATALAARAYAHTTGDLRHAMLFFIGVPAGGYGWIFPLGAGRANVGVGFIRSELGARGTAGLDWTQAFHALRHAPQAAALREATLEPPRAWPIPLGRRLRRGAPGVLLCGDAAGLASPLSGSGIHHALSSGTTAAAYALRMLAGDAGAADTYDRRVAATLERRSWLEGAVHRAGGTPGRADRALAPLGSSTFAGRLLARALLALG